MPEVLITVMQSQVSNEMMVRDSEVTFYVNGTYKLIDSEGGVVFGRWKIDHTLSSLMFNVRPEDGDDVDKKWRTEWFPWNITPKGKESWFRFIETELALRNILK